MIVNESGTHYRPLGHEKLAFVLSRHWRTPTSEPRKPHMNPDADRAMYGCDSRATYP